MKTSVFFLLAVSALGFSAELASSEEISINAIGRHGRSATTKQMTASKDKIINDSTSPAASPESADRAMLAEKPIPLVSDQPGDKSGKEPVVINSSKRGRGALARELIGK